MGFIKMTPGLLALLCASVAQSAIIVKNGFEPADNFVNAEGNNYAQDETIVSPTTDSLGNIWTHSGEGQNWNSNYMGNQNQIQFNPPVVDSFLSVELAPENRPVESISGVFSFDARGGTALDNNFVIEAYNPDTTTWVVLETIHGFTNNSDVKTIQTFIEDLSLYSKYQVRFTGGTDLDRIHFDQFSLTSESLVASLEPAEFATIVAQNPVGDSSYTVTDLQGITWEFGAGSYIKDTSGWGLAHDGNWSWAATGSDVLTIELPDNFYGLKTFSFYLNQYNSNAPSTFLVEKSTDGVTWTTLETIMHNQNNFALKSILVNDSLARLVRITAQDGSSAVTGLDTFTFIPMPQSATLTSSLEPAEFTALAAQNPAASDYTVTDLQGITWTIGAGSYLKDNTGWSLVNDGSWSWAPTPNTTLTIQLPETMSGVKFFSYYAKRYGTSAPSNLLLETSVNGSDWTSQGASATLSPSAFNKTTAYLKDINVKYLRLTAQGGSSQVTGVDSFEIISYGTTPDQLIAGTPTVTQLLDYPFSGETRGARILEFTVNTAFSTNPYTITQLNFSNTGTADFTSDLDGVILTKVASNGTQSEIYNGAWNNGALVINQALDSGSNTFRLKYKLKSTANAAKTLDAALTGYVFTAPPESANSTITETNYSEGNPAGDNLIIRSSGGNKNVNIFMIGGQSNAAGKGERQYYDRVNQVEQRGVEFWLGGSNEALGIERKPATGGYENVASTDFTTVATGTGNRDNVEDQGVEMTLARSLQNAFPQESWAIIKYGYSGSGLGKDAGGSTNLNWYPGSDSDPDTPDPQLGWRYKVFRESALLPAFRKLTERGDSVNVRGFYWIQGEADSTRAEVDYKTDLVNLYDRISRECNAPNMAFYGTRLNDSYYPNSNVRKVFTKMGKELVTSHQTPDNTDLGAYNDITGVNFDVNNVFVLDTDIYGEDTNNGAANPVPGMIDNNLHYNSQALEEMGQLVGDHFASKQAIAPAVGAISYLYNSEALTVGSSGVEAISLQVISAGYGANQPEATTVNLRFPPNLDLSEISKVYLYHDAAYTSDADNFNTAYDVTTSGINLTPAGLVPQREMDIQINQPLNDGRNYFWIVLDLNPASLSVPANILEISVPEFETDQGVYFPVNTFTYEPQTPSMGLVLEKVDDRLIWTVAHEVGVKEYLIEYFDGASWRLYATVTADNAGYYELIVDPSLEYRLKSVDFDGLVVIYEQNQFKHTYVIKEGWNMLALPFDLTDAGALTTNNSWLWDGQAYQKGLPQNALEGFWYFSEENTEITIFGQNRPKSVQLNVGWNLSGLTETAKLPNALTTYTFDESYHNLADADDGFFFPGVGYWIYNPHTEMVIAE